MPYFLKKIINLLSLSQKAKLNVHDYKVISVPALPFADASTSLA